MKKSHIVAQKVTHERFKVLDLAHYNGSSVSGKRLATTALPKDRIE